MSIYLLIGAIILIVIAFIFGMYNGLVKKRNRVREGWADIDVQLKRRYDLIPNLVETVQGYAAHEREVLENVTNARSMAMNAGEGGDRVAREQNENMLSDALKSLFAVSENYPDLKASQNFLSLQQELADTENKIQAARRFYNQTVMEYNNGIQTVPSNIIASMFNFKEEQFFKVEIEAERNVPNIQF